jgi:hypothetical protein
VSLAYYDMDGKPITQEEWVRQYEQNVVKQDFLPNGFVVSTIWLGIDHSFRHWKGPPSEHIPIIFETLVFNDPKFSGECDGRRYSTKAEAEAGHAEFAMKWRIKDRVPANKQEE